MFEFRMATLLHLYGHQTLTHLSQRPIPNPRQCFPNLNSLRRNLRPRSSGSPSTKTKPASPPPPTPASASTAATPSGGYSDEISQPVGSATSRCFSGQTYSPSSGEGPTLGSLPTRSFSGTITREGASASCASETPFAACVSGGTGSSWRWR